MANVLLIAAHCDDEVLGVGATAALHAEAGDNVYLLSLCDRSMNHRRDPEHVARLRKCIAKISEILGIKEYVFAGLEDERMDLIAATDEIDAAIEKFKPNIIYTQSDGDINQDHRTLLHATAIATRTYRKTFVDAVYTYEVPSSTEQGTFYTKSFSPNTYIDVTSVFEKKLQAMAIYEQEIDDFPYPRSLEGLEALAKVRGMESGCLRAEAFQLMRQRLTIETLKRK